MNGLEHFSPHREWYEWTWEAVGHVDNKLAIADINPSEVEARPCFRRNSLKVLVKRLFSGHLGHIDLHVFNCCDNTSEIVTLLIAERPIDV